MLCRKSWLGMTGDDWRRRQKLNFLILIQYLQRKEFQEEMMTGDAAEVIILSFFSRHVFLWKKRQRKHQKGRRKDVMLMGSKGGDLSWLFSSFSFFSSPFFCSSEQQECWSFIFHLECLPGEKRREKKRKKRKEAYFPSFTPFLSNSNCTFRLHYGCSCCSLSWKLSQSVSHSLLCISLMLNFNKKEAGTAWRRKIVYKESVRKRMLRIKYSSLYATWNESKWQSPSLLYFLSSRLPLMFFCTLMILVCDVFFPSSLLFSFMQHKKVMGRQTKVSGYKKRSRLIFVG